MPFSLLQITATDAADFTPRDDYCFRINNNQVNGRSALATLSFYSEDVSRDMSRMVYFRWSKHSGERLDLGFKLQRKVHF